MKKTLVLAACLVACMLAFTGCGAGGSTRDGESLIVATIGGPRSLDPVETNDQASSEIMKQVYNTLFDLNYDTMEPIPSLAESYEFENGDPTRLRIRLRQGVLFHNGEELKASDVKFTIDRDIVSPQINHLANMITNVEVIGDYELVIVMEFPFVSILNNLAHTALSIVNEKAVTEGGDSYGRNPIGTGPMKFTRWVEGARIELTRWDSYWGELPRIKNLTMRYISDNATRLISLETGEIDIALNIQPNDISRIESNPDLQMVRGQNLSLNFIGFNTRRPPFDDLRVRQAIIHAIDMSQIRDTVFQGVGSPGTGPIPSRVWASAGDRLPQLEYNPDRARQLLAEAGYANGFSTKLITNDNAMRRDTAIAAQAMLAKVGIDMELEQPEWAKFLDLLDAGDSEMFMLGWVTVTGDPDYGLEIFHTRSFGAGGNYSFFDNPTVDSLLDRARQETDRVLREEMYFEAQRLIQEGRPLLYTIEGEDLVATRKNVRGFSLSPAGHHSFYKAYVE